MRAVSEIVRIALHHRTGAFHPAVLDPLDRIAVTQNLPTVLGIGEVLETHLVSVDVPVADVVLAPDPAVRLVKFRTGPRRYHRTLRRIADKECAYPFSREQFGRTTVMIRTMPANAPANFRRRLDIRTCWDCPLPPYRSLPPCRP